MKAVVCQGRSLGGYPSREELVSCWKNTLLKIPQISELNITGQFQPEKKDEITGDCDILIGARISGCIFNEDFYSRHPHLKYVATTGHGFESFDHSAAVSHGITFTNTVYGDVTIAQYAMALLLNICHHVDREQMYYRNVLENGQSLRDENHMACLTRQIELFGKTMGIIGLGNIGLWTARMAQGFGMNVIATSRHIKKGPAYENIRQVSMDELLRESDVISIHCPLTEETRHMIDRDAIARMKDGVILINTARGDIIDENAMADALKSGKIYAAGLDVVSGEPLHGLSPIFDCPNAEITAHIAWLPAEARYRTIRIAAENLKNWLNGHPTSVI